MRIPILHVCLGVTVVGVAAALAWLVAPARAVVPPGDPAETIIIESDVDDHERAATILEYDEITRSNLFARNRTPPAKRYSPWGETDPVPNQLTPAQPPRYRLYGVASGPSGAVALIDADRTIPGAEIYRLGDRVGRYILDRLERTVAILRSDTDSLVLTLEVTRGGRP